MYTKMWNDDTNRYDAFFPCAEGTNYYIPTLATYALGSYLPHKVEPATSPIAKPKHCAAEAESPEATCPDCCHCSAVADPGGGGNDSSLVLGSEETNFCLLL